MNKEYKNARDKDMAEEIEGLVNNIESAYLLAKRGKIMAAILSVDDHLRLTYPRGSNEAARKLALKSLKENNA